MSVIRFWADNCRPMQPAFAKLEEQRRENVRNEETEWTLGYSSWRIRPTWCHWLFYFTYVLNMFRALIYPSSGACDFAVELPHRLLCSQFVVLEIWCGWVWVVSVLQAEAHVVLQPANPTAPNLPHTTNREHNNRCGNSTAKSQALDEGYINVRNMLST